MDIFDVLTMLGGLALFLYGMNVLGDNLAKLSGGRLEKLLEKLTSNPFKGVLLGAVVTAAIQSSSATTVMVVGFVNSGIMKLSQAITIIMGANIGTTMTSWILSLSGIEGGNIFLKFLKPTSFSPVLALVGIVFIMFSKKEKKKNIKENDKIKIKYQRDGKEYTTDVTIYKENNHLYIGISVCTILDIKSDFNLKVKTKSSESGPSGGLITALTIYNAITKEDITKGNKIVGTGIIDMEGNVGEIGSVEYKLAGAVKGKADIFICPKENFEAAQKYAKEKNYDIMIVGVATFDEALQTLETLKEK